MSELFNVNTFIVSQVNPYVVPFISVDGGGVLESRIRKKLSMTIKAFIGNELRHIISQLSTIGFLPLGVKRLLNFVTQEYKGHVTIIPQPKMIHYRNVLINPDEKDYHDAIDSSYNSTLQSKQLTLNPCRNLSNPRSLRGGEGVRPVLHANQELSARDCLTTGRWGVGRHQLV
jgi:hypothetical protein